MSKTEKEIKRTEMNQQLEKANAKRNSTLRAGKKKAEETTNKKEEECQDASSDPGATGSGIATAGTGTRGSGLITQCPINVLADDERIEILIGGKRAGNNSPEIINEAAAICQRLFTGGIMDINVFPSLMDEIVDDYRDDEISSD